RRYRTARGLTQEALAEHAGISVRTVSDLERGINLTPRKDTLSLLAAALGLASLERSRLEAAAHRLRCSPSSLPAAAMPALPFVGRAHELALLDRHLAGEGPPLVVLAGEPGIGKSRLLQEANQRATSYGWRVL